MSDSSCIRYLRLASLATGAVCLLAAAAPALGQCALAKLLAADGGEQDIFGAAVAMSGDVVVIGAPDVTGSSSGAAYVYRFDGSAWGPDAKLLPSVASPAQFFGYAVAIDGDAIIIGAWGDTVNGVHCGSAWIFRYTDEAWTEEARLAPLNPDDGDRFGFSVDIDGDRAIVGALWDDDHYANSGSASVFLRDEGTWVEEAKLNASDGAAGDWFGQAVSIDGDVALVGISREEFGGPAYVYRRSGRGWQEEARLEPAGSGGSQFGISAALHGDRAVIGASFDSEAGEKAGATYVFRHVESAWKQEAKLLASDGEGDDQFGHSVAMDGQTIVVGARWDDPYGDHSGSAYIYGSVGDAWTEHAKLVAPDGEAWDKFGFSVGTNGDIAVIGAFADDDHGPESGSAHVFDIIGPDCNENGICDGIDIADGTSEDVNENGIPDECEDLCPEDIFEDGVVNTVDLLILLGNWGPCPPEGPCSGDVDGSGSVDVVDLLALLGAWGPCP